MKKAILIVLIEFFILHNINSQSFKNCVGECYTLNVKCIFENGDEYTGNIKDNCPHGYGTMKYSDGSIYKGTWGAGCRKRKGVFINQNKFKFIGHCITYECKGKTIIYPNGDTLICEWKNYKIPKSFNGKINYKNGDKYIGNIKYNKRDGKGTMKFYNSESYKESSWAIGEFEFEDGVLENTNTVYNGFWKNDKREGEGKMEYANGDVYIGFWKNDKKEGKGQMKFKNGLISIGRWNNDTLYKIDKPLDILPDTILKSEISENDESLSCDSIYTFFDLDLTRSILAIIASLLAIWVSIRALVGRNKRNRNIS